MTSFSLEEGVSENHLSLHLFSVRKYEVCDLYHQGKLIEIENESRIVLDGGKVENENGSESYQKMRTMRKRGKILKRTSRSRKIHLRVRDVAASESGTVISSAQLGK